MKAFKAAAIVSLALLLVMGIFAVYLYATATVEVTGVTAEGMSAAGDPARFEELADSVRSGTFMGTLFQTPAEWKPAEEYAFLRFNVKLRNNCLVPADMVEVQIVPMSCDILQEGDYTVKSLNEREEGTFSATILTAKDTHAVREIIVTYYVWGISFSTRVTAGA